MKSLNLGILAHVDAGKTSLTERLLFNAGITKTLGSVDKGTTQTDSLALEQKRGITIKSAVVSFTVDDVKINLIDTPGHPDFIAEVERALRVLDAVILVISAVEGVQPQTRILMRTLKKMKISTMIFINKVDRIGARQETLLKDIRTKLFSNVIAMNAVKQIGSRKATIVPNSEAVALHADIIEQTKRMELCPVFFGSAITGSGVQELVGELVKIFRMQPDTSSSLSAVIFKIERAAGGEKVAYARIFAGLLTAHAQVTLHHGDEVLKGKITKLGVFQNGACVQVGHARAGDIVKINGLADAHIGDSLGVESLHRNLAAFAKPSLEVVVAPKNISDKSKLYAALVQLGEQDPLISVYQNPITHVLSVKLYGEVQKEVIQEALVNEYGIDVEFSRTTTICIERPMGTGEAVEVRAKTSKGYLEWDGHSNPFLATIGLKIEPGHEDSGAQFKLAKEVYGKMPLAFFKAIEETIPLIVQQGMHGWQVTDCIITLTKVEYYPRQSTAHGGFDKNISSTARDFRYLTPLVFMDALRQATTAVYEPLNRFELVIPNTVLPRIVQQLVEFEANIEGMVNDGENTMVTGTVPVRRTFDLEQCIPDITGGEGAFITEPGGYRRIRGDVPVRPRTDNNPLNREDYFRRTLKNSE